VGRFSQRITGLSVQIHSLIGIHVKEDNLLHIGGEVCRVAYIKGDVGLDSGDHLMLLGIAVHVGFGTQGAR
jgi:hypothetical protein